MLAFGCSAAPTAPTSSTSTFPSAGKADGSDGSCAFGRGLSDLLDSELFEVGHPVALEELSAEELEMLQSGMPPSIDTEQEIRGYVDDGLIDRRSVQSLVAEDAAFDLFTYTVDGADAGFMTWQGSTEIAAWVLDGAFEDCRVDLPAPTEGARCLFGETWDDFAAGDFSFYDAVVLTEESGLTGEQRDQLLRAFPLGTAPEDLFSLVDDGEITTETVVSESGDFDAFTGYYWIMDGAQEGIVYTIESLEQVARIRDSAIVDCTAQAPASPSNYGCLFGETIDDLMQAMLFDGDFAYEEEARLTADSELTVLQARQLGSVMPTGSGGVEAVFAMADDGEVEVGTLVSETTDHDPFTFYSFDRDGEPAGYLFTMESLELVARIDAGRFAECSVAPGADAPPTPAHGPY